MKPPIIFYGKLFLFLKDMLVSWPHTLGAADVFNHSNFLWYFYFSERIRNDEYRHLFSILVIYSQQILVAPKSSLKLPSGHGDPFTNV